MHQNYSILAFYFLDPIEDPQDLVEGHKKFFENRDIRSRIYISEQGINAQMSAKNEDGAAYRDWLAQIDPRFASIHFKIDSYHEHAFPKQCVKYRKQLVGFDLSWDLKKGGEHVSPEKWKEMMESDEEYLFLDIRNDYEYDVGHFEGAQKVPCKNFREFPEYIQKLKKEVDPKNKKVMMCCTGGIRCEIFSAYMTEEGFDEVYQLDGGIINYGHKVGSAHWKGKLFVFDDRMCIPISEEENDTVGKCHQCEGEAEHYYNCANMDCNKLFLCCEACLKKEQGCCSSNCTEAPRLRPLSEQNPHKPFSKWYYYAKEKSFKA